jgi:hypothetical protein
MHQLMGRMAQMTEKTISDNYLKKILIQETSDPKKRSTFPPTTTLLSGDKFSSTFVNKIPATQFELLHRRRSSSLRYDQLIAETHNQFRESITSILSDQMLVIQNNSSQVATQLEFQNQNIIARLNERRVKSLHKSINNSFSRPLQVHSSLLGKSRVRHLADNSVLSMQMIDELPARMDLPTIHESSAVALDRFGD